MTQPMTAKDEQVTVTTTVIESFFANVSRVTVQVTEKDGEVSRIVVGVLKLGGHPGTGRMECSIVGADWDMLDDAWVVLRALLPKRGTSRRQHNQKPGAVG